MMKTAIVYYSMTGNTKYQAETMARILGADLIPLVPKKAYPDSGFKSFSGAEKAPSWARNRHLNPILSIPQPLI